MLKFFPDGRWELHENKVTLVKEVVFAAFAYNPHQIIFRRARISKNAIYLSRDEGSPIVCVVDTESKGLVCGFIIRQDTA